MTRISSQFPQPQSGEKASASCAASPTPAGAAALSLSDLRTVLQPTRSPRGAVKQLSLGEFRKISGRSQVDLAAALGIKQSAVSKIENACDMKMSTLVSYLNAIDAQCTMVVTVGGRQYELILPQSD